VEILDMIAKMLSTSGVGGQSSLTYDQGLSLDLTGSSTPRVPDPHYRLALLRLPWPPLFWLLDPPVSQVRALNTDLEHLLCPDLRATLLVLVII